MGSIIEEYFEYYKFHPLESEFVNEKPLHALNDNVHKIMESINISFYKSSHHNL